jgi:acetoin utilization deacetylase AcuC-like enzyme
MLLSRNFTQKKGRHMKTGLIWDERFAWFHTGLDRRPGPYYQPVPALDTRESKERIRELLVATGLTQKLVAVSPRMADEQDLLRHHTPEYLEKVRGISERGGGDVGEGAWIGPNSYDIVKLAAGSCGAAIDAVLDGVVDNIYALVRPAGHHATRDHGRGFCVLSNIPIAIRRAQAAGRVQRVAVIDWDVHHGNGTQDAFYDDPSVLTISIHQAGNYPPRSGTIQETGSGAGAGFNLNVPLPPGSGHGAYLETMKKVVVPAFHAFRPELILVASGLDASSMDPLARMMCYSETYREMTRMVKSAAADLCGGKLVLCHEGGYSSVYAPWCALAIMEELSGVRTDFKDPSLERFSAWPYQDLQPHQAEVISQAASLIR